RHPLAAGRRLSADLRLVARSDARVHHADRAAHRGAHAIRDGLAERPRVDDGSDALCALRYSHRGEVDVGFRDALADPLVLDGTPAHAVDALLVRLVVVEGSVVADDEEARDAVVRGRPQRGDAHEVIAIAEQRDRDPARPLKRERGADRDAGARTDAGAAITAEVVER